MKRSSHLFYDSTTNGQPGSNNGIRASIKRLLTGLPGVTPHLRRQPSSDRSSVTVSTEERSRESPAVQTETEEGTEEETENEYGEVEVEGGVALTEEAIETHTPDIVTGLGV